MQINLENIDIKANDKTNIIIAWAVAEADEYKRHCADITGAAPLPAKAQTEQ